MEKEQKPTIRFKGFTEAWEQRKLSDIADIVGGGTPSTNNPEYWNGEIDWYAPAEIDGQRYATGSIKKITELGLQKSSATILPSGKTVLFTSRAGIGKMAILQRPAATNQGFQSMVLKEGICPYFIYSMGGAIKEKAEGIASGSTFLEVSGKMLGSISISIPSTQEQTLIAGNFEKLDTLITLHQRKLEKLQNFKKTMLEKMFPQNGEKTPDIRFKGFTEAWEQRKLGEIASLITKGTTPHDKSGRGSINFIKIENIDFLSSEITISSLISEDEHYGYLRRSQLQENDILFSIAGTLGRVATVNKAVLPANTNQALSIIRLKLGVHCYVTTYLKGKAVSEFVRKNPTVGAQPNLSLEQVENLFMYFPVIREQEKIGTFFRTLDTLITLHQRKLEKLQNFKKTLLEKMFV